MNWWSRLLRRRRMEEQLDQELLFHLEEHAAELISRGVAPDEARRRARLELGGPEQVKEACRDARGTRWAEDLWQDTRYALRALRQKPGFAALTLSTLALGIGATTVMFTLVDNVLLKPLPYPEPDRLVGVTSRTENSRFSLEYLANPDFRDCRDRSRSLDLAGWVYNSATLSAPGEAEYEQHFEVSYNLFSVLGVRLLHGRAFLPEEDKPGGAPVAILGHSLWQRHFGGDPGVVGSSLVLNAVRYTVVGIAPQGLQLDGEGDVYTPLGQDTARYLLGRQAHPVRGIGRLRSGATLDQAAAEFTVLGRSLQEEHPDTNKGRSLRVKPLRPDVADVQSLLWLLLGAVVLVLLIACANVAGLLLARAVSRERELAMRVALGAGRLRLVRQCLTETTLLGLLGGLLGIALATVGVRPFLAIWPGELPRAQEVHVDGRVLAFTLGVSLGTGLLFGLAPALRVRFQSLEHALRAGARGIAGSSRRLQAVFVVSEIALSVVLLVAAGLLGHTLIRLSALDPGVDTRNVLVSRMALSPSILSQPDRARAEWDDVLRRTRQLPGVASVAIVDTVPMRSGHNENTYWTDAALPPESQMPVAISTCVTPDYLSVMGIPLKSGRFFSEQDRQDSPRVIVIDDVLARAAFGDRNAIGRQLWIPDLGKEPVQVVGVVGHVRYWGLAGDDQSKLRAQFYYPFAQIPDAWVRRWSELMSIAVRTTVDPLTLVQPMRRELRGAANDQVLYEVRTLEQLARRSLDRQRFLVFLFGAFAAISLLLACSGIYGLLAYVTGLRIPEFGVRMALGATASDLRQMIFRQSLRMIAAGVVAGGLGAMGAARLLERSVDGMQPPDPLTVLGMMALLVLAAFAATLVPALRASRTDPIRALRQE